MKTPDEIKIALEKCADGNCLGCPYYRLDGIKCMYDMPADALEYIQQLENHIGELTEKVAQLEATQPKWISVEERLPDEHGNFLVKIHCDNGDWIEIDTFDHTEKEWWYDTSHHTEEATEFVTHWMPLPELSAISG